MDQSCGLRQELGKHAARELISSLSGAVSPLSRRYVMSSVGLTEGCSRAGCGAREGAVEGLDVGLRVEASDIDIFTDTVAHMRFHATVLYSFVARLRSAGVADVLPYITFPLSNTKC